MWIEGATHVDLYDEPEFVEPGVAKLTEFFHRNLVEAAVGEAASD